MMWQFYEKRNNYTWKENIKLTEELLIAAQNILNMTFRKLAVLWSVTVTEVALNWLPHTAHSLLERHRKCTFGQTGEIRAVEIQVNFHFCNQNSTEIRFLMNSVCSSFTCLMNWWLLMIVFSYFRFLLSSYTAMWSLNSFPSGERCTFKLSWKVLSVNYRSQYFFITHFTVPLLPLNLRSSLSEHLSHDSNSPATSCDVTVATLAQAVAIALPQTHWFRGVVTAQQDLQSGDAGGRADQTNRHHHHHAHMPMPAHLHVRNCLSRGWINCAPSGYFIQPEASKWRGNLTGSKASWTSSSMLSFLEVWQDGNISGTHSFQTDFSPSVSLFQPAHSHNRIC